MKPGIRQIANRILAFAAQQPRIIVALAGPPAAGKSYLSERLANELNRGEGDDIATVVPMDGYHFDNAILEPRGLLPLKGAPETFDAWGLISHLQRIRSSSGPVTVPVFDRPLDLARAGGRVVADHHRIVLVEGNYLLLNRAPWYELHSLFDLKLFLEVPDPLLEARLIQRWIALGQDQAGAIDKARNKDMINAALVKRESIAPDIHWVATTAAPTAQPDTK